MTRSTRKRKAPAKKAKTTKKTAKKRATNGAAKKRTTKKRSTKKSALAAAARKKEPVTIPVDDEGLKAKMLAAGLLFDRENAQLEAEIAEKIQKIRARAQRNSPKWKRAHTMRVEVANEVIATYTDDLPTGYYVSKVMLEDGTFEAAPSTAPEDRGRLLKP